MYVCQYGRNRVVTFKVNSTTHLIDTSTLQQFGPTMYSPDGITVDSNYNVYVCNNSTQGSYPNSVVVLDSSGAVLGSIRMTQATSSAAVNCVFGNSMFGGGPNPHTLYITGDSGAYKVQLKVAGRVRPGSTSVGKAFGTSVHFNAACSQTAVRLFLAVNCSAEGRSSIDNFTGTTVFYNLLGKRVIANALNNASSALYILQNKSTR